MSKSKVERLAEELYRAFDGVEPMPPHQGWRNVARHVLKRERRARGRTVGFSILLNQADGKGDFDTRCPVERDHAALRIGASHGRRLVRVVLVEKPRRGK